MAISKYHVNHFDEMQTKFFTHHIMLKKVYWAVYFYFYYPSTTFRMILGMEIAATKINEKKKRKFETGV